MPFLTDGLSRDQCEDYVDRLRTAAQNMASLGNNSTGIRSASLRGESKGLNTAIRMFEEYFRGNAGNYEHN